VPRCTTSSSENCRLFAPSGRVLALIFQRTLPSMYRHNLLLHDHGRCPLNGNEHCAGVLLVGVLLAATSMLAAQETSSLKKPPVQNVAVLFAGTSPTRILLSLPYKST